jgi:hypothetical protein
LGLLKNEKCDQGETGKRRFECQSSSTSSDLTVYFEKRREAEISSATMH